MLLPRLQVRSFSLSGHSSYSTKINPSLRFVLIIFIHVSITRGVTNLIHFILTYQCVVLLVNYLLRFSLKFSDSIMAALVVDTTGNYFVSKKCGISDITKYYIGKLYLKSISKNKFLTNLLVLSVL